jgi:hypothetical protein
MRWLVSVLGHRRILLLLSVFGEVFSQIAGSKTIWNAFSVITRNGRLRKNVPARRRPSFPRGSEFGGIN